MEFVAGLLLAGVTAVRAVGGRGLRYMANVLQSDGKGNVVPVFALDTSIQTYQQVLFTSTPDPRLSADPVLTKVIQATSTVDAEWYEPLVTKKRFMDNLFYWVDSNNSAVSLTPGQPLSKPRVTYVPNDRPTAGGPAATALLQVTMLEAWPNTKVKLIRVLALRDTVVYIELAGGNGGSMKVYSDSGDTVGSYMGGFCGVVWAQTAVVGGQVIDIFLGQDGTPPTDDNLRNVVPEQDQGGVANMLGGANGGSATVALMYGTLASAEKRQNPVVLLVAGGGGGAGRNAMGGSAGLRGKTADNNDVKYGDVIFDVNVAGFAGSSLNELVKADTTRTVQPSDASGGGGDRSTGGKNPNSSENNGLFILTADEITSFTAGGSARNPEVPAGGGGGGGYYGGGCGGWNGLAKPNNLHGGGGGGSSFVGRQAVYDARSGKPCLNVYRSAVVATSPKCAYAVLGVAEA